MQVSTSLQLAKLAAATLLLHQKEQSQALFQDSYYNIHSAAPSHVTEPLLKIQIDIFLISQDSLFWPY